MGKGIRKPRAAHELERISSRQCYLPRLPSTEIPEERASLFDITRDARQHRWGETPA